MLVLDEPTVGLGRGRRGARRSASWRSSSRQGRTVIAISHDLRFVAESFERVVLLAQGRVVLDGSPAEVFAEAGWPLLRSAGLEPPVAAILGARLGLGSTPTEAALLGAAPGGRAAGQAGTTLTDPDRGSRRVPPRRERRLAKRPRIGTAQSLDTAWPMAGTMTPRASGGRDIARRVRLPPGAGGFLSMVRRISVCAAAGLLTLTVTVGGTAVVAQDEPLKVFGAYATQIEEPWDGVIHAALQAEADAGRIEYTFADDLGYSGDMELTLREVAELDVPDIIFGDAFGNEEAVRTVAADYPDIAFVFGSGGGPADPNLSVFDNWIHEPAYLAGMLAGGLTETGIIGVVGGVPVPEVNRITNAFIAGARAVNPEVEAKVSFINSWFDPAAAKEAALAQIDAGADVLYAERFGVIEAADENDLIAVGNMSDQSSLAPDNVVTSVTWNMTPTVEYVIDQVAGGTYQAQDLKDFSMVAKGGAALAPINTALVREVPADLVETVKAKEAEIVSGLFRVDINEATPPGSDIPPAE